MTTLGMTVSRCEVDFEGIHATLDNFHITVGRTLFNPYSWHVPIQLRTSEDETTVSKVNE